ncbi:MAG TPA: DUF3182 family protein [Noviherbaspirillum sp.]
MESAHPLKPWHAEAEAAVVVYPGDAGGEPRSHERMSQVEAAKRLAAILGYRFAGSFDPACRYACPLYYVPNETLVSLTLAQDLGIHGAHDLFGGVVPFPFIATKTITHPLVARNAARPPGWSNDFSCSVQDVVLPGYAAFSLQDAIAAGRLLLEHGEVRLKSANGIGGLGQTVATNRDELEEQLRLLDVESGLQDGLVLERNLPQINTLSVGQVRVGGLTATYYGAQRLTRNNRGHTVYGGSDLVVSRGDFDALLRRDLPEAIRVAIAQACTYHAAALACFPGMFASRCNYDIAQGLDHAGRWYSGVLEQSWRIGGASGAEIAALEAFQADPSCEVVRASTTEVYGADAMLPPDAVVYFSGIDARVGQLAKYSQLDLHANP